jgi:predicted permease
MRLYRLLLRLYPASFRNEYGTEMAAIVARRLREAGPFQRIVVWLDVVADTVGNAAQIHAQLTVQDLKYAARTLSRTPSFTITAVLVSAIGIGATTAAFSITDHVLIRPLPFEHPDRLVRLYQDQSFRGYRQMELSPPNFRDWQRMATGFQSIGAFTPWSGNLTGRGDPERLVGVSVTSEVLPMLGVQPALGRVFTGEEDGPSAAGTVVLSHGLWQERFSGDPDILGRKILLSDEPYLVVGVMPRDFYFPRRGVRFWRAMRLGPDDFENRTNWFLNGIARLRDGVSIEQAHAQLRLVAAQLERQYPAENAHNSATVIDLRSDLSSQSRQLLIALFVAAVCVLLIACTNVVNLLLTRALGRRRELAVRAALGAGRERLVRQMLTESLLLAASGGALGIALAAAAMPLAARLVPITLPIAETPAFDARVLLFAMAVTVAAAIGFGILPARRAGRVDPSALAEGARSGGTRRAQRLRAILVVTEVTASVVLLVSAGLLIRALWSVQQVKPGFDSTGVLTLRTPLPLPKYEATDVRGRFYDSVLAEIRRLPGVTHAAYISSVPMGWLRGGVWPVTMDGRRESEVEALAASLRFVTPGFFQALRVPLLAGRDLSDRDTQDSPFVAVVSESFGKQYWSGQSPLGKRFFMAFQERTVVGIVGDVRVRGLERPSEPQVYVPHHQVPDGGLRSYAPQDLVVRSSAAPLTLVPAIRSIVSRADPHLPLVEVRLLEDIVEGETAPRTVQLRVLGAFAAVALLLASIGLHGLLAFMVSTQTREIGVRIALGAPSPAIAALVVRRGLVLAAAGAALGVAIAYGAGRTMQTLLAGISPTDPLTYGAAVALVLAVTVAGTLVPAVRAVRIDPLTAIRTE